jgi:hypothetical protein
MFIAQLVITGAETVSHDGESGKDGVGDPQISAGACSGRRVEKQLRDREV